MKLVVEGMERYKRIISAGYSTYKVNANQAIIEINDADWKGYRKADVHWDDELKKIIEKPYPLSTVELTAKQEQEDKANYIDAMPDIVKELQAKVQVLEEKIKTTKEIAK